MPEISIVVPIYNMEKYLKECICSIQNQDYDNYEIILVDDGSTDSSYDIALKFTEKDTRIKIVHQKNEGVSVARNTGLKLSMGEWVMFVDPDDTLYPTLISELLSKTNDHIDIVACCCNAFNENVNETDYFFSTEREFSSFDEKKDLFKQLMNIHYGQPGSVITAIGVPWGKIYRRSFLTKYHLCFIPCLKRYQDNLFNMYAFFYAREVYYLNKPLYNYRLNHIQKFKKTFDPGYQVYMGAFCEERYTCMKQLKLLDDKELKTFYCAEILGRLWRILCWSIFASENSLSYIEKKAQAESLCEKECFQVLFQKIPKGFTCENLIKWFLVKGRHFRIISMMQMLKSNRG